ncbi:MAG: hypothetical protein E7520_03110 [Ruminococcaceae bacterium]|nr:hypothetical protein [Oscillospiraceae bacterium]
MNINKELKLQIYGVIDKIIKEYLSVNQSNSTAKKIYKKAIKMVKHLSAGDIITGMEENNVSLELVALNILQNCAMLYIKPASSASDLLFSDDDASKLYNYLNDEKQKRGLITNEQYEENKNLCIKIRMGSRFL